MKTRKFTTRNGAVLNFTELGFGTAPLGNLYRPLTEKDARTTLNAAWDVGCRVFDTAPLYGLGLAETRLNGFLREHARKDYILSTKVGRLLTLTQPDRRTGIGKFFDTPARQEVYDYSYDGVMRSIEFSLERLGVDQIDILLCHDVDIFTHGSKAESDRRIGEFMAGGYKALHKLRDEKVIKAFGAGINEWQVAETLARAGDFDLFLLAGRYTLLEQEALTSFLPYCEEKNIGILLGGPYNSGILATGPKPGAFYNYDPAPPEILERVARIAQVCKAHGVKLAEAAIRFPLGHKQVVCVIPGGQKPLEVKRNAAMLQKRIPAALWRDLKREGLMRADAPTPK
ncbi:aldo/keto reductase [Methylovirgula sp. 4M-Z18]|uniref:aldo/keto reductase n=1 Tax=Methylovirgula sp. 4M-Z18 TaxID=2293567 RepID=UPI000E2FB225|nr:aldo/keto reductase [Methylovirgula sp. 4M-Z18]RFB78273.1 aldo/keto reductase [Methylovirgula sp. 4M-Z18]